MKRTVWLALIGAVLVSTAPAAAQCGSAGPCVTEVGGLILENTTWDLAGSPYCIKQAAGGAIMIGADATLTIEAGVEVRVENGLGITVGHIGWGIGTLKARGTEASPICITSLELPGTAAPGDWTRIWFTTYATDAAYDEFGQYLNGCILEHVIVEYSGSVDPTVPAITGESCSPYLAYCQVHDNAGRGISVDASLAGDVRIEHCIVHDNGSHGIVVDATTGGIVAIDHCEVYNHPNGRGITVLASSVATIEYCEIHDCTTTGNGGGIYLSGGADHTVSYNIVDHCTANRTTHALGGGIYVDVSATLEGNTVTNNSLSASGNYNDAYGGGIYVGGPSTLSGNTVTGNSLSTSNSWDNYGYGGGIYLGGGTDGSTLSNNTVTANTANSRDPAYGGGICLWGSSGSELTSNPVTGNSADGPGGGICLVNSGGSTLTGNTVTGNWTTHQDGRGGGIYLQNGNCTLTGNTVTDNHTSGEYGRGGGISLWESSNCWLQDNTVTDNNTTGASAQGGGIYLHNSGITEPGAEKGLQGNWIVDNHTTGSYADGGGVYVNSSGDTPLVSNTIAGNTCGREGGGIKFNDSPDCTLTGNMITDNTSTYEGGGIYFHYSANCTMTESCVTYNHTVAGSTGGIYVYESTNMDFSGDLNAYNTICGNDGYCIYNNTTFDPNGSGDIDATYVYWCTDDIADIQACIHDYFDDPTTGFVFWNPFISLEPGDMADMNCDGAVDAFDIDGFVMAITDPGVYYNAYPCCCADHGDINGDGAVDAFDIDPFVQCILLGGCP